MKLRDAGKRLRDAGKQLRHPKTLWAEHRRLCIAAAAIVVIGIAGGILAYQSLKRPDDVHYPDCVFKPEKP